MTGNTLIGLLNPIRYRGYYYDIETGLYYLQTRYYDPETGRFINADGLLSTGQGVLGYNMFAYCMNNPENMVDFDGNKPGDLFNSPEEAAIDFALCYNEKSIKDKQEYGSAIYSVTKISITFQKSFALQFILHHMGSRNIPIITVSTKYSYTEPFVGKNGKAVIPNIFTDFKIVTTVHTHANYSPKYKNEVFSKTDRFWSNLFKMDSYLVTPGGYVKKYTYENRNDENGGVTIISSEIPWDPNSPDHCN